MRTLHVLLLLIQMVMLPLLLGCERKPQTVTIGFVGVMSGRSAGLGTDGRDGFLLALNEANRAGGINGRSVVPLVLDSGSEPNGLASLVGELRSAGARAAVGPMRSQVAKTLVPLANSAQLVMISPTVSSDALQGQDDYFFRNYYSNSQAAAGMARLMCRTSRLTRIAVLYNTDNRAYTEDYLHSYRTALASYGAKIITAVPFSSLVLPDYSRLKEQVLSGNPQAVLVLANAVDSAMFCQQIAKGGRLLPIFTTPWSFSDDLIAFGGQSVEGVTLLLSTDPQSDTPAYVEFRRKFIRQYGREPRFSAIRAYDAGRMLIAGMRRGDGSGPALKQSLLELGPFPGIQNVIEFDAYGDLKQPPLYPVQVARGAFVSL